MANLKYQGRDFIELRDEIIANLKENLGDAWTDQSSSDPMMIMLEQLAFLQDNLNFYIDQQKRESDIITATRLRNVWNKALRDGYKPHSYKASEGNIILRFTGTDINSYFENVDDNVVFILKKGSNFQSSTGSISNSINVVTEYDYMLFPRSRRDNDENISRGYISIYPITTNGIININDDEEDIDETYKDGVPLEFSIPVVQGFYNTQITSVLNINENLYISLNTAYAAEGKTKVSYISSPDSNEVGEQWEEVDDVFSDYRQGKIFSINPIWKKDILSNVVQFNFDYLSNMEGGGNGFIKIEYIETLGAQGVIAASEEDTSVVPSIYTGGVDTIGEVNFTENITGNDISSDFSVYNVSSIAGGMNLETITSIKSNFKKAIKVVKALITLSDFEDYVSQITGLETTSLDWSYGDTYSYLSKSDVDNARVVYVFVALPGGSEIQKEYEELKNSLELQYEKKIFSKDLRDIYASNSKYDEIWNSEELHKLKDDIESKKGRTDKIYFYGPEYIYYNISATILLDSNGDEPEVIMQNIINNLEYELGSGNEDKKKNYFSKILATIQNSSPRIKSVIMNSPLEDIEVQEDKFLRYNIEKESFCFKLEKDNTVEVYLPLE